MIANVIMMFMAVLVEGYVVIKIRIKKNNIFRRASVSFSLSFGYILENKI